FGKEVDVVAFPKLSDGHEQPAVLAVEDIHAAKRRGVDPRDVAAPDVDPQRLNAGGAVQRPQRSATGRQRPRLVRLATHPAGRGGRPGDRLRLPLLDGDTRNCLRPGGRRAPRRTALDPALDARPPLELALATDDRIVDDQPSPRFDPALDRALPLLIERPVPGR